jgi:hypothetical protein
MVLPGKYLKTLGGRFLTMEWSDRNSPGFSPGYGWCTTRAESISSPLRGRNSDKAQYFNGQELQSSLNARRNESKPTLEEATVNHERLN